MKPVDALLAVTYRCNARCVMCGIWKSDPCSETPAETYRKLPSTLRDINLSGGEPFLRDDLAAIHAIKGSGVINDTNGLELINDDTIPNWLLARHKKDGGSPCETLSWRRGDVIYDLEGKPFLSLKTMISLLMGAMRQEDNKVEGVIRRLEALET